MSKRWLFSGGLAAVLVLVVATLPVYATEVCRDASGNLTEIGSLLGCGIGTTRYPLDASTSSTLATDIGSSGGGLHMTDPVGPDADGNYAGTITLLPTPTPGPTSSILAAGASAGSGATVALVAGAQSDRFSGALRVTTGLSPTAGAMIVVTYPQAFGRPARVFLQAINNGGSGILDWYPSGQTTTGVTINVANQPAASTTYDVEYMVVP